MALDGGAISSLLRILEVIINELKRWRRDKHHQETQQAVDDAKKDPVGAFNAHFSGMCDNADSTETNKAKD